MFDIDFSISLVRSVTSLLLLFPSTSDKSKFSSSNSSVFSSSLGFGNSENSGGRVRGFFFGSKIHLHSLFFA